MSDLILLEYQTPSGTRPFSEWMRGLKDRQGAAVIRTRMNRARLGHLGHFRHVGDKVWEFKIDFGPGYRVYFLRDGQKMILLLCGGDKSSQTRDIEKAKNFAEDYWRRK